jgi:hypothetical protein
MHLAGFVQRVAQSLLADLPIHYQGDIPAKPVIFAQALSYAGEELVKPVDHLADGLA